MFFLSSDREHTCVELFNFNINDYESIVAGEREKQAAEIWSIYEKQDAIEVEYFLVLMFVINPATN